MRLLKRFVRQPSALLGAVFLLVLAALAIAAPWLTSSSPWEMNSQPMLAPFHDPAHWLGSDLLGRDLGIGLLYGARVSLAVGVLTSLATLLMGLLVGAIAGYFGGWVDGVLMRIAEFFQTLPRFVVALIVIALFGTSVFKMIVVIAALSWPQLARVVRASVATLAQSQFVDAARVAGMGNGAIIVREILPNAAAPIVVLGSLDIAMAILIEASLSFFGLGDPNHVSWGAMLNDAQQYLRSAWWMSAFPGLAIALTVLSFNLLGDALNDALNPRGEGR